MKIAISSTGNYLQAPIDPRFGRCPYFIFVEPETMKFEAFENEGGQAAGGAGIQAAQFVVQKGASAVLTGDVGPNAASVLSKAGVKIYLVPGGTAKEVTELFKTGSLREGTGATSPLHSGAGRGRRSF
jgi:predicted Fe-Mo cluster-binding NifX family protein